MFGVVVFGVFHGLFFLPAVLSIIGPAPYDSAKKMESTSKEADFGREEGKDIPVVASHTNKAIENGNTVLPGKNGPFNLNNVEQSKNEPAANGIANGTPGNSGTENGTLSKGSISVVEMHL